MVRAIVVVVLLALAPSVAHADKRLALLIGNEAYAPTIGALANPHNVLRCLSRRSRASDSRLQSSATPASAR